MVTFLARCLLILGLSGCWPCFAAGEPVGLAPSSTMVDLSPPEHLLHDPLGTLDAPAAAQALRDGNFRPNPGGTRNFGFLKGAMWMHFAVEAPRQDDSEWLLVVEYTLLDRIDLFRIDRVKPERVWLGGDRQPFSARSVPMRYFNVRQSLAAGEQASFLIRIESESSLQVPLVWASEPHYLASSLAAQMGLGLYFGLLLALVSYNFILYLSVRDPNFLYYVVYVLSVGLMLFCLTGLAFQHLWPEHPDWANTAILLSISLALTTMLQFTRRFLDLRRQFPLGDQLLLGLMAVAVLLGLGAFLMPYSLVIHIQTLLVFPAAALIYLCGLVCLRHYPPARYFLIAWTALLAGILVYASVSLGWLPKNGFTEYAIQIGSAAEMVLLSFALAYRINMLTAANQRMGAQAREELEDRVRERTADLDAALKRLEDANRLLEDFSRRDGLTGSFNRRSFDHILRRAELARLEHRSPFALMMIDVDNFKEVNDHHGHLVGDDCLRYIAQAMEPLVRSAGGQLARYGGEEFAVLLEGADLEEARQLAETLRVAVSDRPLITEGRHVPLSISVGVAAREADAKGTAIELVRAADQALYRAKEAGRNRVVVASA